MNNKAVFLDRDGTINVDYGYVYEVTSLKLLPDVVDALKMFQNNGFKLIVVTNQSGIGRGLYSINDAIKFNEALRIELRKYDIHIQDFFICPHAPEDKCKCRKPSPLMVFEAIKKYHIDSGSSYMFGDKISDVQCGQNTGIQSFLVDEEHSLLYWAKLLLQ